MEGTASGCVGTDAFTDTAERSRDELAAVDACGSYVAREIAKALENAKTAATDRASKLRRSMWVSS
jgi:hypothetical protein